MSTSAQDLYFMGLALEQAQKAFDLCEVPVGAVVVCDDALLATAHNSTQTLGEATAHAELLVLQTAMQRTGDKYLPSCTLYTTLEPCVMCAGATYWAQIGKLVYGASDAKRGYSLCAPSLLHPKTTLCTGVCAQPSQALLQKFFQQLRLQAKAYI